MKIYNLFRPDIHGKHMNQSSTYALDSIGNRFYKMG